MLVKINVLKLQMSVIMRPCITIHQGLQNVKTFIKTKTFSPRPQAKDHDLDP